MATMKRQSVPNPIQGCTASSVHYMGSFFNPTQNNQFCALKCKKCCTNLDKQEKLQKEAQSQLQKKFDKKCGEPNKMATKFKYTCTFYIHKSKRPEKDAQKLTCQFRASLTIVLQAASTRRRWNARRLHPAASCSRVSMPTMDCCFSIKVAI